MKKRYVAVFGDVPALVEYFQGDYKLTRDINKAKIFHSTKELYWELDHAKCTGLNRRLPTHSQKGYGLDKDILVKGNKIYSEDTCVFVPRQLNCLLIDSASIRGDLPLGVSFKKQIGKFQSQIKKHSKNTFLGYYDTPEQAYVAYKEEKENHVKEMAEIYRYDIDIRVYEVLKSWKLT